MAKSGAKKSFSGAGLKKSPKVNKTNPTGGIMKQSGGFVGRAYQTGPTASNNRKGNP